MDAATALALLRESVKKAISGEKVVAVAYSGGLDSSLIASLASECAKARCCTCFFKDSFDDRNAKNRAESEGLDLVSVELTSSDIPAIVREVAEVLNTSNPVEIAYTIPVYSVLTRSSEKLVLAGNGADELFGGYAKYSAVRNPEQMMVSDLAKMLKEADALRGAAGPLGKRIEFPFVSKDLIEFSRSLPMSSKISSTERKVLLRDVARLLKLPSHNIPKKAAQYSSGILKEMERQASVQGKQLPEWARELAPSPKRRD